MGVTAAQAAAIIGVSQNAVPRMVYKGQLPKPVRHQRAGFDLADVERASLERYRLGRPHPYWATEKEAASILGMSRGRVQQLAVAGPLP